MWIREYFDVCKERIAGVIHNTHHEEVINKSPEKWIDELVEACSLPLVIEQEEPKYEYSTVKEIMSDYGRAADIEAVYLEVEWRLVDHSKLGDALTYHPSPHDPTLPPIVYKDGYMKFKLRVGTTTELDKQHVQERIKAELNKTLDGFRTEFKSRNEQIERGVSELRSFTEEAVKKRREQIEKKEIALKQISEKIQIPLKKKSEEIKIIKINHKNDITETKKSGNTLPSGKQKEYILNRDDFIKFIGYIHSYMRSCERTPIPFNKLEEEHIRDLMLPYLNQVFTKGATGETFSKFGKTDIYLVIGEGCILICECKWWRGPSSLVETIDQVLKRITWRENYGIVIIFAKGDITDVLAKSADTIKNHASNMTKEVKEIQEHHLYSNNSRQDDRNKTVEIHYLFYNFPNK